MIALKFIVYFLSLFIFVFAFCWGSLNCIGKLNVLLYEKEFRGKRVKMPRHLFVPRKGMDVQSTLFPFSGLSRQDDGKVYFLTLLLTIINYLALILLLATTVILYFVAKWSAGWIALLVIFPEIIYILILLTVYEIVKHKK